MAYCHVNTSLLDIVTTIYYLTMPNNGLQSGMFESRPKKKNQEEVDWPPVTLNWPRLEKGLIPRPRRMPDSLSLLHLANYVAHYRSMFPDSLIDSLDNHDWTLHFGYRTSAIVVTKYTGLALSRGINPDLAREMADELTAPGTGYEWFHSFAGNWFAYRYLQIQYKNYRYRVSCAAAGKPRSTQMPYGRLGNRGKKVGHRDRVQDSNAGGRAASQRRGKVVRTERLSQSKHCSGCGYFVSLKDFTSVRFQSCFRHEHNNRGQMVQRTPFEDLSDDSSDQNDARAMDDDHPSSNDSDAGPSQLRRRPDVDVTISSDHTQATDSDAAIDSDVDEDTGHIYNANSEGQDSALEDSFVADSLKVPERQLRTEIHVNHLQEQIRDLQELKRSSKTPPFNPGKDCSASCQRYTRVSSLPVKVTDAHPSLRQQSIETDQVSAHTQDQGRFKSARGQHR
ncbi:hypothetical protein EJ07DRAFT_176272 [Lizonia empirigonia]|nr:hypothetical protein EJ07DRAFT_176272 [Lizonia empirigonia]